MSKFDEIIETIEAGRAINMEAKIQEAIIAGFDPDDILNSMISAMDIVGEKFQKYEIFVPEMLVSASAMKKGVKALKPYLLVKTSNSIGKMVMGTVAGDLHDIGKNLVIMMVECAGLEVIDLGVDVPIEKFIEATRDPEVNIVGASALLTTTMPALRETVKALNNCANRSQFKVMVGGTPITQKFADEIGADTYTEDAATAAQVAKSFIIDNLGILIK